MASRDHLAASWPSKVLANLLLVNVAMLRHEFGPTPTRSRFRLHASRTAQHKIGASMSANFSEINDLLLRKRIAEARVNSTNTSAARAELDVAESELMAYSLINPSLGLISAADSKVNTAQTMQDMGEAQKLQREMMDRTRLETAVSTLAEVTSSLGNADWREISESLAELHYWVIRGSDLAESVLLEQLTKHKDTWIATEADALIRKAWVVKDDINVMLEVEKANHEVKVGNVTGALAIYDIISQNLAPEWAECWHRRGVLLHRALRRFDESERSFEKALSLNPRRYPTMLALAKVLMVKRDDRARARSSRALELLNEVESINPSMRSEVEAMKDLLG